VNARVSNADGSPIKVSALKKTQVVADKVVGIAVGNTVGRVFKFAGKRLLGRIPDEALKGSFVDDVDATTSSSATTTIASETSSDTGEYVNGSVNGDAESVDSVEIIRPSITAEEQQMLEDELQSKCLLRSRAEFLLRLH
jgi:hypothetical protein